MANLSQEQLLLLEMLTYMDDSVREEAGASTNFDSNGGFSLGDIFASYDTERLRGKEGGPGGFDASYQEWADIIDAIKSDPELSKLKLTNERLRTHDNVESKYYTLAYVYADPDEPTNAVVTFKGTTGPEEWMDDLYSGGVSDTPPQKNALNFVDSLPYTKITVTGHSKGGNKAQYVALFSDKVKRCVSYDGEGFSTQFIEKYGPEIQKNASKLECVAFEYDYVHELMHMLPGASYYYIRGEKAENAAMNHAAQSMMKFVRDKDGNPRLVLDYTDEESKPIQLLRDLANYLLYATQESGDWEKLDPMLEQIIAIMLAGTPEYGQGIDGVLEYVLGSPERQEYLGLLLSYIYAYGRDSGMTDAEFSELLDFLGITGVAKALVLALLKMVIKETTDGMVDTNVEALIAMYGLFDKRKAAAIKKIWESTERNYLKQPRRAQSSWRNPPEVNGGRIFDFTNDHYNQVMASISQQNGAVFPDFNAAWNQYSSYSWYSQLKVALVIRYITNFCQGLNEINLNCGPKLETVFNDAEYCDRNRASQLPAVSEKLNEQKAIFMHLRDSIVL